MMKIQNIVGSLTLGKEIPIDLIQEKLEEAEYEPEQFPGLILKLNKPKVSFLVFRSGRIIGTGAKDEKGLEEAFKVLLKKFRELGIETPETYKIRIVNIVASIKLKTKLNLNELAEKLEEAEYEPEQFPGLMIRLKDPKTVFLLFGSGKIVCTGAIRQEDIEKGVKLILERLKTLGIEA